MVEIPEFYKKPDFYGVLLPGYLTVTLYILIFRPAILFNPAQALSFDLFSAVVFVIFGPAIGLALQQFHRRLAVVVAALMSRGVAMGLPAVPARAEGAARVALPPPRGRTSTYYADYGRVRMNASPEEKAELDLAESQYDFSMSAGIALFGLGVARSSALPSDPGTALLLLLVGVIFVVGGYAEWRFGYLPVFDWLNHRYPA